MRSKPSAITARLKAFTENLEAGIPIEATFIRRVTTPDGPVTLREPGAINVPKRNNETTSQC